MPIPIQIENAYLKMVDTLFERWPQPSPSIEKLSQCKIISHRGEHHDGAAVENTIAAFDRAAQAGVWGIEFDVRWTRDLIPVVAHDADTHRLYNDECHIAETSFTELKRQFPTIAALDEVVDRFGKQIHLMIEIKQEERIDQPSQDQILSEILRPLNPGIDYHLLALAPQVIAPLLQTASSAKILIGYYLPGRFSRLVLQNHWGGFCGHYLMTRQAYVARHKDHGQQVGTGFVNSPNALMRELNRGIDWIFSDNAAQLQTFVNDSLKKARQI